MIRIEDTEVFGFRASLRDLRNPKESWDKSDSKYYSESKYYLVENHKDRPWDKDVLVPEFPEIGEADLKLMKTLCWGGGEHRKFLREIQVWVVIYPSRDLWQEIDTYKVGTVRNSCSTMHKLGHRPLTREDFNIPESEWTDFDQKYLDMINELGFQYRNTKSFEVVKKMKKRLYEGFIQRAGYHLNYENLFNMFLQRKDHRLDDWRWNKGIDTGIDSLCNWIYRLPYMAMLLEDNIGSVRMKSSEVKQFNELLKELVSCVLITDNISRILNNICHITHQDTV
jgi:hypothetical protein